VAPGAVYTLTFSVTANPSDAPGTITNTATWSGPSCGPPPAPVGVVQAELTTTDPTTCPTNSTGTPLTAAPVVAPVVAAPPTTTTTAPPAPAPTTAPAIAFTGALLSDEWLIGSAAVVLGLGLVVVARRRRRTPRPVQSDR
jgi:hypothetical protein